VPGGTYGRSFPGTPSAPTGYRMEDDPFGDRLRNPPQSQVGLRRSVDGRGVFVAAVGLVLLGACFLPYYTVSYGLGAQTTYTVMDTALGVWRLLLPAVAAATVVVGVANSMLRVGQKGAVGVFYALRFLVLGQLVLWIVPIVVHHLRATSSVAGGAAADVTVGWLAYSGAAVALVALAGSLSSMGKSDTA